MEIIREMSQRLKTVAKPLLKIVSLAAPKNLVAKAKLSRPLAVRCTLIQMILQPLLVLKNSRDLVSARQSKILEKKTAIQTKNLPLQLSLLLLTINPLTQLKASTDFQKSLPELSPLLASQALEGKKVFHRSFKRNPAPGEVGLGAYFNANRCVFCHAGNGGGLPPAENVRAAASQILFRLARPQPDGVVLPEPNYGGQFRPGFAVGLLRQGWVFPTRTPQVVDFEDGSETLIWNSLFEFQGLAFGEFAPDTVISSRIGSKMIGLGYLEAIPESTLQDWADKNGGKINWVLDHRGQKKAGRMGWRAGQPDVAHQVAGALLGDLGIESPLASGSACGAVGSPLCKDFETRRGRPRLSDEDFKNLVTYSRTIDVPARDLRLASDWQVKQGDYLFEQIGCGTCHVSEVTLGKHSEIPNLENKIIHPYTDLLTHDMGQALADFHEDGSKAAIQHWRTAPLWGLGKQSAVTGKLALLHDGRARTIEQAILWHGGEALTSRDAYRKLKSEERSALLAFLNSL
jgi:CxxC motif-containing protein (DUF1111 family)